MPPITSVSVSPDPRPTDELPPCPLTRPFGQPRLVSPPERRLNSPPPFVVSHWETGPTHHGPPLYTAAPVVLWKVVYLFARPPPQLRFGDIFFFPCLCLSSVSWHDSAAWVNCCAAVMDGGLTGLRLFAAVPHKGITKHRPGPVSLTSGLVPWLPLSCYLVSVNTVQVLEGFLPLTWFDRSESDLDEMHWRPLETSLWAPFTETAVFS